VEHDADTEPCGDGPLQSGVLSRAACREEGKGGREAGREGQTDARSCETRRGSVGVTEGQGRVFHSSACVRPLSPCRSAIGGGSSGHARPRCGR
jgi:hypothetical protein